MSPGYLSHILAPVNAGRKIQEGVSHVIELLEIVVCGLRGRVVESEGDMARETVIVRTQPYVVCHHWTYLAPKTQGILYTWVKQACLILLAITL